MAVLCGTCHTRLLMISVLFGARDLGASGIFHITLTVHYCHYCAIHCHCWMNLPVGPPRLLMAVFTAIATLSVLLHDTVCTSGECYLQLVRTLCSAADVMVYNCLTLHI